MSDNSKEYWNEVFKKQGSNVILLDNWLDEFYDIIEKSTLPIVDLGCGSGGNTLYLVNKGKKVICCDYSEVAIENIKKNFPNEKALCFDMTKGLPFDSKSCEIIIADLSLHYFDEKTTFEIIKEIKRCLVNSGILLARVNSINDINYGASSEKEIEKHLYEVEKQGLKRFFDEEDINYYFKDLKIQKAYGTIMTRYRKDKKCYVLELIKE